MKHLVVLIANIVTLVLAYPDSSHNRYLSETHISLQRDTKGMEDGTNTLFPRGSSKKSKNSKTGAKNVAQAEVLTKAISDMNIGSSSPSDSPRGTASASPKSTSSVSHGSSPKLSQSQPGSGRAPSSLSSPRGPIMGSPNTRRLEEAQANIARGRGSGPSSPASVSPSRSPSPPLQPQTRLQSPQSSLPQSSTSQAQSRIPVVLSGSGSSDSDPQTDHDAWLAQGKKSMNIAQNNAKNWEAHRRARNQPTPHRSPSSELALRNLRSQAKISRGAAREAAKTTAATLQTSRPLSPSTYNQIASSTSAGVTAIDLGETYWSTERNMAKAAVSSHRWHDVPKHITNAARSSTRTDAIKAYHTAEQAQWKAQAERELARGPFESDADRSRAMEGLVSRNRQFRAAADEYYMRENWYRETRNAFPDGSSSDEEAREFAGARKRGGAGGGGSPGGGGGSPGGGGGSPGGGGGSGTSKKS